MLIQLIDESYFFTAVDHSVTPDSKYLHTSPSYSTLCESFFVKEVISGSFVFDNSPGKEIAEYQSDIANAITEAASFNYDKGGINNEDKVFGIDTSTLDSNDWDSDACSAEAIKKYYDDRTHGEDTTSDNTVLTTNNQASIDFTAYLLLFLPLVLLSLVKLVFLTHQHRKIVV